MVCFGEKIHKKVAPIHGRILDHPLMEIAEHPANGLTGWNAQDSHDVQSVYSQFTDIHGKPGLQLFEDSAAETQPLSWEPGRHSGKGYRMGLTKIHPILQHTAPHP